MDCDGKLKKLDTEKPSLGEKELGGWLLKKEHLAHPAQAGKWQKLFEGWELC
jgi:hypothetical protein